MEGDAEHSDMLESVKQLVQNRCSPMVSKALQHVSFPARALPGVYDEGALDLVSDSNSSSSSSGDASSAEGVLSTRRYRRARPAGSVPCRLAFAGSSCSSGSGSSGDGKASDAQLTAQAAAAALDGAVVHGRALVASALGIVDAKTRAGDELGPEDQENEGGRGNNESGTASGKSFETSSVGAPSTIATAKKDSAPTGCVVLLYHLCAASELEDPEEADEVLDNVRLLVGGALPPSAAGPEHAFAAAIAPPVLASALLGLSSTPMPPTPPPLTPPSSTSVESPPAEAAVAAAPAADATVAVSADDAAAVNVDVLWLRAEKGGDPERFKALLQKRCQPEVWVDEALAADAAWRASVTKQQSLVAETNKLQKEVIGPAKKAGQDCVEALKRVAALKQESKALLEPLAAASVGEVGAESVSADISSVGKPSSIATLEAHAKACLKKLGKVVVESRVGNLVELAELDEEKVEAEVGQESTSSSHIPSTTTSTSDTNSNSSSTCGGILLPSLEGFPVAIAFRSSVLAAYACERLDGAVMAGQHLRAVIANAAPSIDLPPPPPPKPRATAAVFVPGASGAPGAAPEDKSPETGEGTGGTTGGASGQGAGDNEKEEMAVVLTRNGKKIPVKYAPTKAVPKVPNAQAVREYVTQQRLDPALDALCFEMVEKLFQYQERVRLRDPTKAKQRRRLVFGLREVKRGIKLGQVKCVVVAPNIDEGHFAGGLDDTVNEIISLGRASEDCTVLFALSKKKLGKALGKNVRVSAVGIYSMDGAYDAYKKIVKLLPSLA